jgi:hypothetical protein
MTIDVLKTETTLAKVPVRLERGSEAAAHATFVGAGTKWHSPIGRRDVETLVSSQPDIAKAWKEGGWKAGAVILYRDYLLEEAELDPTELRGQDLVCTCKLSDPCHADVLLELANA